MGMAIETAGLTVRLGGYSALDDVSLRLADGAFVAILGPNGAGKSTLLRALDGLLPHGAETIQVRGRALASYSRKALARILTYVPQLGGGYLPFTVHEFVMMGRYPHLSPFSACGPEDQKAVREALALTGATELAERHLATLSGGERQRVALAAALAQATPVLLLDEPAAFLDPKHQAEVQSILHRINRERNATVLAVTHDVNMAALHSHRVIALKAGRTVFDGPASALMDDQVLERIYEKSFLRVAHPHRGIPMVVPDEGAP
jgi:iron complex transport system ATP-binding protein